MNETIQKRIDEAATIANEEFQKNASCLVPQKEHFKEGFLQGHEYALSNQWISVEEALPPYEEDVFVRYISHENEISYCVRWRTQDDAVLTDKHGFSIIGDMNITHWMPIPKIGGKR